MEDVPRRPRWVGKLPDLPQAPYMQVRSKAKITSKGEIALPVAVRERLGVGSGDTVTFVMTNEGIFLNKETDPSVFAKWDGRFRKGKGKSAEEIDRFIREMRGHDDE